MIGQQGLLTALMFRVLGFFFFINSEEKEESTHSVLQGSFPEK